MTAKPYPNLGRHDSEKFYYDPKSKSKRLFPDYASSPTVELSVIVPAYNEEKRRKFVFIFNSRFENRHSQY